MGSWTQTGGTFVGSHSLEEYLGRSQPEGNVGGK